MAGAKGLFGMQDKGWTNASELAMQGLNIRNSAEAAKTKEIKSTQTTYQVKPKTSLGSVIGGLAGSMLGNVVDPLNMNGTAGILGSVGAGVGGAASGMNSGQVADAMGQGWRFGDYYGQNYNLGNQIDRYGGMAMSFMSYLGA